MSETSSDRLRRLLEPQHERALGFARGLCRSRSDGDDLYQDALLRALTKLDGLREDGAFRVWLYRVIVSVHRNKCTTAFWRRLLPFGSPEVERAREAPEPGYREGSPDAVASIRRARDALATLPPEQRIAIVLFELDGWSVEEIAALDGVSLSAVKSRLARGRERLRTYYEREHELPAPILQGDSP